MERTQLVESATGKSLQHMTFWLGGELYAVPILSVQEIRRYSAPTTVPDTPAHVLGVINLRGTVVPIIDLRVRFGLAEAPIDRRTVVIVIAVSSKLVGLVVDDVGKVLEARSSEMQPAPAITSSLDTSFISGMLREAQRLVIVLDVDQLVARDIGADA